jgi:hypothetical protein
MTPNVLREICESAKLSDITRAMFSEPWALVRDGKPSAVATNGMVMARIFGEEAAAPFLPIDAHHADEMGKYLALAPSLWLPLDVHRVREWAGPAGWTEVITCDWCKGEKKASYTDPESGHTDEGPCEVCEETGKLTTFTKRDGKIGGLGVNRAFIASLLREEEDDTLVSLALWRWPRTQAHCFILAVGGSWRAWVMGIMGGGVPESAPELLHPDERVGALEDVE